MTRLLNRHAPICDGWRDSKFDYENQPDLLRSLQNYLESIATIRQSPFDRLGDYVANPSAAIDGRTRAVIDTLPSSIGAPSNVIKR
jgi:hypothetical protein